MQAYQAVFILRPDLDEKGQKEILGQLKKIITDLNGKLAKTEVLAKKELVYPIKKFREGIYLKADFSLTAEKVKDWEAKLKQQEKIIRHLLIRV